MLSGEKVLVTGGAGRVAFPIARELAKRNEVWAMARFSNPADAERLKAHGISPIKRDLAESFDGVAEDFTYVWHAGALVGEEAERDWRYTFEVNAQATGRLMKHCRGVKGFLHCSTGSQYHYQGHRPLKESDPPGIHTHIYSLSKIAAEAVVLYASREWDIPTTMIRICSAYGPEGGAPVSRLDALVEGRPIRLHPDKPNYFNPIHEDDQVELGIKALELGGHAAPNRQLGRQRDHDRRGVLRLHGRPDRQGADHRVHGRGLHAPLARRDLHARGPRPHQGPLEGRPAPRHRGAVPGPAQGLTPTWRRR